MCGQLDMSVRLHFTIEIRNTSYSITLSGGRRSFLQLTVEEFVELCNTLLKFAMLTIDTRRQSSLTVAVTQRFFD